MKILIAYATNSGSTFLVADQIRQTLSSKHDVMMKYATDVIPDDFANFSAIIMGSPSWDYQGHQGYPHEAMVSLTNQLKSQLFPQKPFAVFGCGDANYAHYCGAVDYLSEFIHQVDGFNLITPLKINGYYFDLNRNTVYVENWARQLSNRLHN